MVGDLYNRFVKEILLEYEKIRNFEERELELRKQYVYSIVPRVKEIEDEVKRFGLLMTKAILSNETDYEKALEDIKNKMNDLKQEKAILMTENNIPLSYMDINYRCTTCKDTGFTSTNKKCNCFKQKLVNKAYDTSNLSSSLNRENFDYFDFSLFSTETYGKEMTSPRSNMEDIYQRSMNFIEKFHDKSSSNLLFYGTPGSGKTFMCNCIAKELLDKGQIVVYQTAFKILEILGDYKLRNSNAPDLETSYQLLFDSDLLIIDDLGTELTNTFTTTELFNIINTRLINNKKMIISTNLNPKELPDIYSFRISSRIFGSFTFLKFYGKDLRWE